MRSLRITAITALLMSVLTVSAFASNARLQVIHNAADPAVEFVDIYVNNELFLDNFEFRTATPFVDVPAGVQLIIGVAPGNSAGPGDIIAPIPVTLERGGTYVAVANGVLDPSMFSGNPDKIGFSLFTQDRMRERAYWHRVTKLRVFHGATDAPAIDVIVKGWPWGKFIDDLSYGEFSHYRTLFAKKYILDITPAGQNDVVVKSYVADLSGLGGAAGLVFASGFLDPSMNQNGAPFGLFVALPNGDVAELPENNPTARLQIIHNAADPGAAEVDIYVNDELFLDDFAFRTATPFVDVPAGVDINVGVAPGSSTGPDDIIAPFVFKLMAEQSYVAIANGVLSPNDFAPNPDSVNIGFNIFPRGNVYEKGYYLNKILAFHGSTDAPTVDILVRRGNYRWKLFNNLSYTEFSDYRWLLSKKYILDVTPGNDNHTVVASFEADLRGLKNAALIVFASGFLDPSANQNGAGFGLYAALPDGTVIPLPAHYGGMKTGDDGPVLTAAPQTERFALGQNKPNPFNPTTIISFSLAQETFVTLNIYNVRGQLVEQLVNESRAPGPYSVNFDASGLASGVYFYRLTAGDFTEVRKMMLVK